VNRKPARPFLPTALFILLSAVFLTGNQASFADNGFSTIDPFTSAFSLPGSDPGKPDGYDNPVHRASCWIIAPPGQSPREFSPNVFPVLAPVFPASQARAPPQS
jgi:hypothetical protein